MYYYNDGEREIGPFGLDKLAALKDDGIIGDGTLVRHSDTPSWQPLGQILDGKAGADLGLSGPDKTPSPMDGGGVQNSASATPADVQPDPLSDATAAAPALADGSAPPLDTPWRAEPATPWRRYGARLLDTLLNGAIGFFLIGVSFYAIAPATADSFFVVFETPLGRILDAVMTAAIASLIGGALIGVSGLTLGKVIFGVKVTRLDGGKLGLWHGLARDFTVLVKGVGLGIPIIALITMLTAYNRLRKEGVSSWDEDRYIVWHRPGGSAQILLNVIGIALIFLLIGILRALATL